MHTPGPWSFDGHGINATDGRRLVTFQKPPATAPSEVWMEWIEAKGRIGHTLAAAPELLAELEALTGWVRRLLVYAEGNYISVNVNLEALRASLDAAEKTIKEAKGG